MPALLLYLFVCLQDLRLQTVVLLLRRPDFALEILVGLLEHSELLLDRVNFFLKVLDLLVGLLRDLLDGLGAQLLLALHLLSELLDSRIHRQLSRSKQLLQPFLLDPFCLTRAT